MKFKNDVFEGFPLHSLHKHGMRGCHVQNSSLGIGVTKMNQTAPTLKSPAVSPRGPTNQWRVSIKCGRGYLWGRLVWGTEGSTDETSKTKWSQANFGKGWHSVLSEGRSWWLQRLPVLGSGEREGCHGLSCDCRCRRTKSQAEPVLTLRPAQEIALSHKSLSQLLYLYLSLPHKSKVQGKSTEHLAFAVWILGKQEDTVHTWPVTPGASAVSLNAPWHKEAIPWPI